MINLVSYPRSGNTFLRNVLFEVYGVESKTYHDEAHGPDAGWETSPVVKTHLLPSQLPQGLMNRPVVYLVRDGRDAVVSLSYHKRDLHDADADILAGITEVIYAAEGSYFSGWSKHVSTWLSKAVLVIYFEELIRNPIAVCERLRPWLKLPSPEPNRLPSFEDLKEGRPEYGSGKSLGGPNLSKIWFRSGIVGSWKVEMTKEQHLLFWHLHGEVAESMGYSFDGEFVIKDLQLGEAKSPFKLLLEAGKLLESHRDGIGRYVENLVNQLALFQNQCIHIDVLIGDQIFPIDELELLSSNSKKDGWFFIVKRSLSFVLPASWYNYIAKAYANFRLKFTNKRLKETGVTDLSNSYDVAWLTLPQHYDRLLKFNYRNLWVTVHDLSHSRFPEFHTPANISLCNHAFEEFKKLTNVKFFSVSQSTQFELAEEGIEAQILYEAVDRSRFFKNKNEHLSELVKHRYGLPNGKFLLSLFTLEPRKNLKRLLEAYRGLPEALKAAYPLVIAGRKGWKWREQGVDKMVDKHIHYIGYIQEDHLVALYSLAHLFIYPSIYEGFGLPILEAQACGLPVLTSNTSSMPEVGGEAAMYFNPKSTANMREVLQLAIARTDYTEWCEESIKNTWRFSWYGSVREALKKMMMDNDVKA